MCPGIPLRVVEIRGRTARREAGLFLLRRTPHDPGGPAREMNDRMPSAGGAGRA